MFKRYFLDHRVRALVSLITSVLLFGALLSYNPYDPSFNTAVLSEPTNILGYVGAYTADILLQIFGIGSALLPIIFCVWACVLLNKKCIEYYILRNISLLLAMMSLSCATSAVNIKIFPAGASGVIGYFVSEYFGYIDVWLTSAFAILSFVFFITSTGFSIDDVRCVAQRFKLKNSEEFNLDSVAEVIHAAPAPTPSKIPSAKFSTSSKNNKEYVPENAGDFVLPGIDLLGKYDSQKVEPLSQMELEQNSEHLLQVLSDFGVKGKILDISQGPVVTLYEFEPSAGTKSSRVIGLADDIARSLSAVSTRIAVIPGRNALGIELPNKKREFFSLRDIIPTQEYIDTTLSLPIILGKDLGGKPAITDLAKMPHLLVAGTTGSGKSVAINAMIISLLYKHSPATCKFIMIDPKMLELSVYDGIPHLLTPVVTESGKAVVALKWAVKEMENRYRLMSNLSVRNIYGYNERIKEAVAKGEQLTRTAQTGFDPETGKPVYESIPIEMEPLPFIVVIVDEMADLMIVAGKDIEASIQRLAQMARAAGIHLIMATQRPSVDVITGVIKANFPSRVSFKVTSKIDSRTILGEQGAEQLLGMGDMLYMGGNSRITRVHGPFVDDREVENITNFLKAQGTPEYVTSVTEADDELDDDSESGANDGTDDESLYRQAMQILKRDRKASTSYIQRSLRIGYNRAALIIERMEREGVVSPPNHSGKREILLPE